MDVAALSMAMSQSSLITSVQTAVLAKSLDSAVQTKDAVKTIMEQSVNPNLGKNIDISV